ncbi:LysR family transcriptional regulator [Rhodobium gokarnense]|uniref:DNA-binding transcriptional LysR family regulator n=1 Tax=Rhodobium gokarnense TaxID=364296 RepID=A0ABT3HAX6_9HYPH|nr:LysR family transcriptional regulator [Rhodobium gokarnense]MCW2307545.1 DNA-binding transcriptional LysR family regulator [Rhodobium gokarnense]
MARTGTNRSGEMEVFVQVVERGGFSHAARQLGLTQSAVSKLVSRLEARLGARLFNRSTRRLDLTAEGCAFYERAAAILADMDEAERQARRGEQPVGRLRLNTSASYAVHVLEPILPAFVEQYPEIVLDLVLTDTVIDLLAERTDVVVRAGPLKDSRLVARKLGETPMWIVASPDYLKRAGTPHTIADLDRHRRIGFGYPREIEGWRFESDGEPVHASPAVAIQASDGETMRRLALQGLGLARLAAFTVRDDIAAGRLEPVLEDLAADDREAFHAVYTGQGGPLPARVRALLDFLAEHGSVS